MPDGLVLGRARLWGLRRAPHAAGHPGPPGAAARRAVGLPPGGRDESCRTAYGAPPGPAPGRLRRFTLAFIFSAISRARFPCSTSRPSGPARRRCALGASQESCWRGLARRSGARRSGDVAGAGGARQLSLRATGNVPPVRLVRAGGIASRPGWPCMRGRAQVPSRFPAGTELTHILVVADAAASREIYRDVVGAEVVREYGGAGVRAVAVGNLAAAGDRRRPQLRTSPPSPLPRRETRDRVSHAMRFQGGQLPGGVRAAARAGRAVPDAADRQRARGCAASSVTRTGTCWN